MATAAATSLLENVIRLLKGHVGLISDAKDELEQLKNEIELLKAFLVDKAEVTNKNEMSRELEGQIRQVCYEAEDTIDTCLTEAATLQRSRYIFKRAHRSKRIHLAKEIKSLREGKLKRILDMAGEKFRHMRIGDGSGTTDEQRWTKAEKAQTIRHDAVVGFEDEKETLIGYLMEQTEDLDVISIIGMPGVGKTTLAWKIYQDLTIRYEFPIRVWVYVPQEFNKRVILLNILKALTSNDMSRMSDHDLLVAVRTFLEDTKFLLVIDDVWTVEAWKEIRDVFPRSNWASKVLITSRDVNVGWRANVNREPHMLRFLTPEESWELLQLEVFGELHKCPQELKVIGEIIAKECHGLPLPIVVIGGILREIYSRFTPAMSKILDAWNNVSKNISTYVNKEHSIIDVIELSYNTLRDDLKTCFLYLGVFPEDYEIPVWTLTNLWIAEGFIQPKGRQMSLEETANGYLEEFINKNLVMVGRRNPNGELKTCRVHDMIREFCISQAKEQDLFQEIQKSEGRNFQPPFSDIHKYRRLCIHSFLADFFHEIQFAKLKGQRVRSVLCFCKPVSLDAQQISAISDAFILLRVLDSKSIKLTHFPNRITKLIHLRYITLSCNDLTVLPESIAELWNLQTILVETMSRTLEIKANLWKMLELRHLKTKAAIILAIKGEATGNAGQNLQTISRLSPKCCTIDVFSRAREIKRLGIRGSLASDFDLSSLGSLYHLENLKLMNDLTDGSPSEHPLPSFPQPNCFPKSIKRLTLSATYLEWKQMSTLGMIDTLQVLKLKDYAFTGNSWHVDGGFHSLQFLLIDSTDLVIWQTSDDDFPALNCLVLKNCEKLKEIPLGLVKSLQVLMIERVVPKSIIVSARKIEEQKKKMLQGPKNVKFSEFKLSIGLGCE